MRQWKDQKVVILGAARQGLALAQHLAHKGARVVVSDVQPEVRLAAARERLSALAAQGMAVSWVFGGHPMSLLEGATWLCPSGGVPLTLPLIEQARKSGIQLTNDSQVFLEAAPCRVIGITGSAGKTTTTMLVGRMALAAVEVLKPPRPYRKAWIGGNIGNPLIAMVDEMQSDDLAVMELSSFQLEIMNASPHIAAVLNITPNHLDRHGTMEAYTAAKERILAFQTAKGLAVLNRDDPGAWALASKTHGKLCTFGFSDLLPDASGVGIHEGIIFLREDGRIYPLLSREDIGLRGDHNLSNVLAACAIAAAADLPVEAMRAGVIGFHGVPHRLEYVRTWRGAKWYNDSIATAPERAMAAIRSFDEPLVLLAGGRDKNLPWDEFAEMVRKRVDHLVLFGEGAGVILTALALTGKERFTVQQCTGLHEAVYAAAHMVEPGDVVLLSPGCTSFDEFRDFEERGKCFAEWVNELP